MQKNATYLFTGAILISWFTGLTLVSPTKPAKEPILSIKQLNTVMADTLPKSGKRPRMSWKDRLTNRLLNPTPRTPLILKDPKPVVNEFQLDSAGKIAVYEKLKGDKTQTDYRPPQTMSYEEFMQAQQKQVYKQYWRDYAKTFDGISEVGERGILPKIELPPIIDRIFGGSKIDFNPNGYVTLDFGVTSQFVDNPIIPVINRRVTNFRFDQQAAINFNGKIGDKLNLNTNFDTKASFNFQNLLKLNYRSQDEDILQKIEAGNTSFQVPSQLIPGVQNLFGINTKFRFGNLDLNLVAAQQRSKQNSIKLKGGVSNKPFEARMDLYDENRHFFLSQFFRNNYERSLKNLPLVASGVNITRVEVYVTNRTNNTADLRNIVALTDLGESKTSINLPTDNGANDLFRTIGSKKDIREIDQTNTGLEALNLQKGVDFEVLRGAKKLTTNEFRFNAELGYISLLSAIKNDEVLAVSYEYTYQGRKYKVGELTEDYQNRQDGQVLVLKMLKSSTIRNNTNLPMWNLMMKNVYSLKTTNITRQGFQMRIIYKDDITGMDQPNIQEGRRLKDVPLVKIFNLDQLNQNNDPQPDGNFDFVEGITVDSKNGVVIFPVLEPFGSHLRKQFDNDEVVLIDKYVSDKIYRSTQADASQQTEKNKFFLKGTFQGALGGGGAVLPFGVDPKSVRATAGGVPLTPGVDFTVDQSGTFRMLNESILSSGREVEIQYEQAELFANQTRTLLGVRADYRLNKDTQVGFTYENMSETPPANIRRVALGNEPINNQIIGVDINFRKESKLLTRFIDALPLISTKEISQIQFAGEYAHLIPGVSPRVNDNSYLDDFEASRTVFDLTRQATLWRLGSTPVSLPEGKKNTLEYGFKRAKISAYTIDNTFYANNGGFGNFEVNFSAEEAAKYQYEKYVYPTDIFRNQSIPNNLAIPANILDIAYFPSERGMYNYNTDLDANGLLKNPRNNFGSITRAITSDTDFDNSNIETLELWLLDPFVAGETGKVRDGIFNRNNTTGGKLQIHLGDVSEDVIPDSRYNFENGLPLTDKVSKRLTTPNAPFQNVDSTAWGYAPRQQYLNDAFDNTPGARERQDVGLDGLTSAGVINEEATFFKKYIDSLRTKGINAEALSKIAKDPSADDFQYYIGGDAEKFGSNLLQRYKNYSGVENNSPPSTSTNASTNTNTDYANGQITPANNVRPDKEDLNNDNTVNDVESYYQYDIDLRPGKLEVGQGYIVDKVDDRRGGTWYLFRIPIRNFSSKVGGINNFKSMRFMRMVMTDFEQPVVLRFAQLQLTGYQYRKYLGDLSPRGLQEVPEPYDAQFKVGTVSVFENSAGSTTNTNQKVSPYTLPPGFRQDQDITTFNSAKLNEQSMTLSVTNLRDGDSRAVFKNTSFDLINYKRLKMFIHMENPQVEQKQVSVFMRLGTDLTDNYYEIETSPLTATNPSSVTVSGDDPSLVPDDVRTLVWPTENEIDLSLEQIRSVKSERDKLQARLTVPYKTIIENENGLKYSITVVGRPNFAEVQTVMIGVRNPKIAGDGEKAKTFTVWVDELRGSGFDQTGGSAAIGKMSLKLADFANVTLNGGFRTFGFGGVQSKISDRARETTIEYGIAANINLDKLLPQKWGWKIPMYIYYDRKNISPHFNPFDPDTPLDIALSNITDPDLRSRLQSTAQDNTVRQGINFANVRKIKMDTKRPSRVYDIENFSFSYSYSGLLRTSPLIDEFRQESYKGGITYTYTWQPKGIEPFKKLNIQSHWLVWLKDFNISPLPNSITVRMDMDRSFWKTQNRNSDFTTAGILPLFEKYWYFNRNYNLGWNLTKSIVMQYSANVQAIIDEPYGDLDTQQKLDSVRQSLYKFGRSKNFDQNINITYRLPLNKLPLTDWMTADLQHRIGYQFVASSYGLKDSLGIPVGNIIKNLRSTGINGRVDLVALYNRIKAFRIANTPRPPRKNISQNPGDDEDIYKTPPQLARSVTRLLMTVRGIQYNLNFDETTTLPGFLPTPGILGNDWGLNAPGLGFILGSQDGDIRYRASENGWLSKSPVQPLQFIQTFSKTFSSKAQLEPFKDFKIQLEVLWKRTDNYREFYRPAGPGQPFESINPVRSGNFSMSFLSFFTAFSENRADGSTGVFEDFRNYRQIIKNRLDLVKNGSGEYNLNSQDVLIPAFFAAYAGKDPNKVDFSPFYGIPLPNWRIDYNGLTNYGFFKRTFSSFTITHDYKSTYSVGDFTSSLEYNDPRFVAFGSPLYQLARFTNADNALVPVYVMSLISFQEKFSPLIGINAVTKSKISARLEYNQDRNVGLNLSNAQVAEIANKDLVIGIGFTKNDMRIPFTQKRLKNDLKFQFNLTFRDSRVVQRKLDAETVITQGFITFQMNPTIDYVINQSMTLQVYFTQMINDPLVSNNFYRSNTTGGFRIRFNLADQGLGKSVSVGTKAGTPK